MKQGVLVMVDTNIHGEHCSQTCRFFTTVPGRSHRYCRLYDKNLRRNCTTGTFLRLGACKTGTNSLKNRMSNMVGTKA